MAAATTASDMAAGPHRTAIPSSEKFIDWQQQLCSARAVFDGAHKRRDGIEQTATRIKKSQRHRLSSSDESGKLSGGVVEDRRVAEAPSCAGFTGQKIADDSILGPKKQECQSPQSKKQHKELSSEVKKVKLAKGKASAAEQKHDAGSRLRKCSKDDQLVVRRQAPHAETSPDAAQQLTLPPKRRRRLTQTSVNHELESVKRTADSESAAALDAPNVTGTKRTRGATRKLATEEPPPPAPLKLPKLHLVLTRKEILEDLVKITGQRYSGKPKKSRLNQLGLGLCTSLTCPSRIRYLTDPPNK